MWAQKQLRKLHQPYFKINMDSIEMGIFFSYFKHKSKIFLLQLQPYSCDKNDFAHQPADYYDINVQTGGSLRRGLDCPDLKGRKV